MRISSLLAELGIADNISEDFRALDNLLCLVIFIAQVRVQGTQIFVSEAGPFLLF